MDSLVTYITLLDTHAPCCFLSLVQPPFLHSHPHLMPHRHPPYNTLLPRAPCSIINGMSHNMATYYYTWAAVLHTSPYYTNRLLVISSLSFQCSLHSYTLTTLHGHNMALTLCSLLSFSHPPTTHPPPLPSHPHLLTHHHPPYMAIVCHSLFALSSPSLILLLLPPSSPSLPPHTC